MTVETILAPSTFPVPTSQPRSPRKWLRRFLPLPLLLALARGGTQAADPAASPAPPAPPASSGVVGNLVVVGGGKLPDPIRDLFVHLAGDGSAHIVIIPTASIKADSPEAEKALAPWQGSKVASLQLLHTRAHDRANDAKFLKPLHEATGVWLCGGDQRLLTGAYLGTAFVRELKQVLDRGGVIGGTSAGAAVMSRVMIAGGTVSPEIAEGFGLLPGTIVDQHFFKRNRAGRLQAAVAQFPDLLGVGIDEETGVVVHGDVLEVLGVSRVALYDRTRSGQRTRDADILTAGTRYNLKTRQRLTGP